MSASNLSVLQSPSHWDHEEHNAFRQRYGKWLHDMEGAERDRAVKEFQDGERKRLVEDNRRERLAFRRLLKEYGAVDLSLQRDPDRRSDDLVRGVFGRSSNGLLSGQAKIFKTMLAVDLAVSISTGTKFLNYFDVDETESVLFLSYEAGELEMHDRVRRVLRAKGIDDAPKCLAVLSRFPQLNTDAGLDALGKMLSLGDFSLVIADCLYAGFRGIDLRQLSSGGGELASFQQVCARHDATPMVLHHDKRGKSQGGLSALSGAGVAEWAGQWMCLSPVGRYDASTGTARLRMEIGSRAGYGGTYVVDIREGCLNDAKGRVWETLVSVEEPITDAKPSRLREAIVEFVKAYPGATKSQIRRAVKRSSAMVTTELTAMEDLGILAASTGKVRGQHAIVYSLVDHGQKADQSILCPTLAEGGDGIDLSETRSG